MARKSKSPKSNDNTEQPDASEAVIDAQISTESSQPDAHTVVDAEAIDVTEEVTPAEESAESHEEILAKDQAEIDEHSANSDAEAEPSVAPAPDTVEAAEVGAIAPPPETQRASALPLVFGGALAAGMGYLAATFVSPPPASVDTGPLSESIAQAGTRLDTLSAEFAELKAAPAAETDLSGIEDQIAGIATRLDNVDSEITSVREAIGAAIGQVEERASSLSERLTILETAGPGDNPGALATEDQLAAFRAELERMSTEAEASVASAVERANALEEKAAETTAAAEEAAAEAERQVAEAKEIARREAAIVDLKAALENGTDYSETLPIIGEVPEVLAANAAGVPTLLTLQQSFPDAARQALSSAETVPQDASAGDRLTAFLKRQTNARSLAPKEGDGADAVLSRAEALLKQGNLGGALVELEALSEAPKAAMQGWLDSAITRAAALEAAAQLNVTN